tara:strand:+ start:255 stop:578 length:324 start_codon:yes stop_codon:yes gene_type:complete
VNTMLSSIKTIIEKKSNGTSITSEMLKLEIDYISKTLELMRDAKEISNDAYLDSGSIQGGLSVISSLIEQNISDSEIDSLMQTLNSRAINLEEKYPGLSIILESYRE